MALHSPKWPMVAAAPAAILGRIHRCTCRKRQNMTDFADTLAPPNDPALEWCSLGLADLAAIAELAAACLKVDGGLPLAATEAFIQGRYFQLPAQPTIGAFDRDGRLHACAAVRLAEADQEYRALIVGQVHPADRRRGLGTFLLDWSMAQARALLGACAADRPHQLCVATESLTEASEQLYTRRGLAREFGELVMLRELRDPLPAIALPDGIVLAAWAPSLAEQFFVAYQASFRERPGFPGWSAQQWIEWVAEDDTFLPELSLLALQGEQPVGFIVCAEEWIVQVGVRPEQRGRGLGAGLVAEALRRFRAAGTDHVLLDVNMNNPGAERVYARLGFVVLGRRARYTAIVPAGAR